MSSAANLDKVRVVMDGFRTLRASANVESVNSAQFAAGFHTTHLEEERTPRGMTLPGHERRIETKEAHAIGWRNDPVSVWPHALRAQFLELLAQAKTDVFQLRSSEPEIIPEPMPGVDIIIRRRNDAPPPPIYPSSVVQVIEEGAGPTPHSFEGFLRYSSSPPLPQIPTRVAQTEQASNTQRAWRAEATLLHQMTQVFVTHGAFEDEEAFATLTQAWVQVALAVPRSHCADFLSEVFDQTPWRDSQPDKAAPPMGFFDSPAGLELFRRIANELFYEYQINLAHSGGMEAFNARKGDVLRREVLSQLLGTLAREVAPRIGRGPTPVGTRTYIASVDSKRLARVVGGEPSLPVSPTAVGTYDEYLFTRALNHELRRAGSDLRVREYDFSPEHRDAQMQFTTEAPPNTPKTGPVTGYFSAVFEKAKNS